MSHNCPDCARLCYCDMEDVDWGFDYNGECYHYLSPDCECECDQCLDEADEPVVLEEQA